MIATTKRQLGNDENADPERPSEESEKDDTQLNGVLPLTRVKRLIKMSSMSNTNVSAGAAKLIQLCAEEYLRAFVRTAKIYAEQAGRKTVQPKDLTRVIKDDWAFALLEDTLADWPNDNQQPKLQLTTTDAPRTENDSISMFFRNNDGTMPDPTDTPMTNRDTPQIDDDYGDIRSDCATELNETTDIFPPDSLEALATGDPTPKPTMEYLHPQDTKQCRLSAPLTFNDNSPESDDEQHYQELLLNKDKLEESDEERPHNSRFMNSRRIEDNDEPEELEEEMDDNETLTPASQLDLDIEDMEDGFF